MITRAKRDRLIADRDRVEKILQQLTERRVVRIISFATGKKEPMYERIEESGEAEAQAGAIATAVDAPYETRPRHRGDAMPINVNRVMGTDHRED